jgi:hypothetical protein
MSWHTRILLLNTARSHEIYRKQRNTVAQRLFSRYKDNRLDAVDILSRLDASLRATILIGILS